jgi:hypothetical protein
MRVVAATFMLGILIAGAISLGGDRNKADALFAKREDPKSLEQAISEYEAIGDLTQAMRCCYLRIDLHDVKPDDQVEWIDRGLKLGKRIFGTDDVVEKLDSIQKDKADALYWYAQLYALKIQHAWKVKQAFMAGNFRKMGERAVALDEAYNYGGPRRMLGNFLADAPGFMGGDEKRAVENLERAVELGPDYFENRMLRAELVHGKLRKDRAAFRKDLDAVINGKPEAVPDRIPEQKRQQHWARKLLEREKEIF